MRGRIRVDRGVFGSRKVLRFRMVATGERDRLRETRGVSHDCRLMDRTAFGVTGSESVSCKGRIVEEEVC